LLERAAFLLAGGEQTVYVKFLVKTLGMLVFGLVLGAGTIDALEVRGRVLDAQTNAPLEEVQINAVRQTVGSDAEGYFALEATLGDTLRVWRLGYESQLVIVRDEPFLQVALLVDVLQTQEVVVVGGLRTESLAEIAAAVTVVDARQMRAGGSGHIQDLVQAVPNLNWAGGTSRPRYFQIRGIGERSQYAGEGPPSFSVGFVVDDIELSGLGSGMLFDLQQVEVFKGPQSSAFGPNALAGLVHMKSANPASTADRQVRLAVGGDGLLRVGAAVNVPVNERLALRAGYQVGRADGFRENIYLGKDDTNGRRESILRLKARYAGPDGLLLLGTFFRAGADNGYDMWTPDNNKDLVTYSDKPGDDHQTTNAFSLRAEWPLRKGSAKITSISTYAKTDLDYSFDSDWGNGGYWKEAPYNFDPEVEGWSYDFFDRTLRERTSLSQELRLAVEQAPGGGRAIVGLYFKTWEEQDNAEGYLFGGAAGDLRGTFDLGGLAFYAQYEKALSRVLDFTLNARADRSGIDYAGQTNAGAEEVRYDIEQWLPGFKTALTWHLGARRHAYAAVSRGYRAGGINQHPYLAAANRPYDPEYMLNFELGYRTAGPKHSLDLVVFHALRDQQQVSLSSQQNAGDPNSFFYFTANAASGRNSGAEVEGHYRLHPNGRLFGSLAYLNTHVDAYSFAAAAGQTQALGGREAAHAPEYALRLGGEYAGPHGFFARGDWSYTDAFFFSDSHDQVSEAYALINTSVGYDRGAWSLTLWARNLLDERYAVRGFYFGLAPPDYADTLYLSYGDPRQLGLSLDLDL
jgi:iron complex outermembrane receptor protein